MINNIFRIAILQERSTKHMYQENTESIIKAMQESKGNSCAYSPICWDKDGNCIDNEIVLADSNTEKLFYADFDIRKLRNYRSIEMMGNTFRKVKAYKELMNEEINEPFIR